MRAGKRANLLVINLLTAPVIMRHDVPIRAFVNPAQAAGPTSQGVKDR
jgi:hypothetical protein